MKRTLHELVRGSLGVLSPRDLDWRHHEGTRGREERKGKGKGETRPGVVGCWVCLLCLCLPSTTPLDVSSSGGVKRRFHWIVGLGICSMMMLVLRHFTRFGREFGRNTATARVDDLFG